MTRGVLTERRRFIIVRYRAASAFAPLPFDKHGVPGSIEVVEDFTGSMIMADLADTTGVVWYAGETTWWGAEIAGAAVSNITLPVGESDHPGIARLEVGSTSASAGDACSLQYGGQGAATQDQFLLDTNGVYIATVIRIADVDAAVVEFGLGGQTPAVPNSSVTDTICWSFDPADTTNVSDEEFFAQVNGASSDTEVISKLVSYVESDWVLLEIAADSSSATFRITTEDNTETIVIDGADSVTMPIVALRPYYVIENVGNAEEVLDIDLFVLRYIRRQPLVASWLGQ